MNMMPKTMMIGIVRELGKAPNTIGTGSASALALQPRQPEADRKMAMPILTKGYTVPRSNTVYGLRLSQPGQTSWLFLSGLLRLPLHSVRHDRLRLQRGRRPDAFQMMIVRVFHNALFNPRRDCPPPQRAWPSLIWMTRSTYLHMRRSCVTMMPARFCS